MPRYSPANLRAHRRFIRSADMMTVQDDEPVGGLRVSTNNSGIFLYYNPCLGVPPIAIETPLRFFGVQAFVGVCCLLALFVLAGF